MKLVYNLSSSNKPPAQSLKLIMPLLVSSSNLTKAYSPRHWDSRRYPDSLIFDLNQSFTNNFHRLTYLPEHCSSLKQRNLKETGPSMLQSLYFWWAILSGLSILTKTMVPQGLPLTAHLHLCTINRVRPTGSALVRPPIFTFILKYMLLLWLCYVTSH